MIRRHIRSRGVAILSVLMALVIIFVLLGFYFSPVASMTPGAPGVKPWPLVQLDRTKQVVCQANQRTALSTLFMDQIDRGGSFGNSAEAMQRVKSKVGNCPAGGEICVLDDNFMCTLHDPTTKFHERLGLI